MTFFLFIPDYIYIILLADNKSKTNAVFTAIHPAAYRGGGMNCSRRVKLQLRKEYDRYAHVFEQKMTVFEQNEYESLVQGLMTKNDGLLDNITDALSFLMERLEKYYHKKVMVFIDEYDTPFIEAHVGGYYEDLRGGLSSLLHDALKTSTSLHYAMMTGIQRVAKENIFSDLNNLVVCTVKDPEYSQYFGFTEEETK